MPMPSWRQALGEFARQLTPRPFRPFRFTASGGINSPAATSRSAGSTPHSRILHYPVKVGDTLVNRYILNKRLGEDFGTRSSVWLSADQETGRDVVLKITGSDATPEGKYSQREAEFLHKVAQKGSHPNVMAVHGQMQLTSEHGTHSCMVLEHLGPSVLELQISSIRRQLWPISACKEVIRQTLRALDFLHRECGIVHTDIKLDNILVRPANAKELGDGKSPLDLSKVQLGPDSLVLSDLGVASWADEPFDGVIQPICLRSPEVFLRIPYTTAADIWNMGVIAFEFITRNSMFIIEESDRYTPAEDLLTQMMCFAQRDRFPLDLLKQGRHTEKFFDMETGKLKNKMILPDSGRPMWSLLTYYRPGIAQETDVIKLGDFLASMIELRPQDRPTAAQLLEHDWLKA